MNGITDLTHLLRHMNPERDSTDWAFTTGSTVPQGVVPFATVAEAEGLTIIAPLQQLQEAGLPCSGPMARITLKVHSSLQAVGLTAAFSSALAQDGISANVIAGFYHDHIFLPSEMADRAMAALKALSHV